MDSEAYRVNERTAADLLTPTTRLGQLAVLTERGGFQKDSAPTLHRHFCEQSHGAGEVQGTGQNGTKDTKSEMAGAVSSDEDGRCVLVYL